MARAMRAMGYPHRDTMREWNGYTVSEKVIRRIMKEERLFVTLRS